MNAVGEPGNVVPCTEWLRSAKLQRSGAHACHGGLRFKRSRILGGWFGWRIEQRQKPRMGSVVQEERALVEDRILGMTACALQHELRKFLTAQGRRAIEQGLCLRGSADLDHIVFASASMWAWLNSNMVRLTNLSLY